MDIFDLNNPINFNKSLQDNVNILFKTFGKNFIIKNDSVSLSVILTKSQSKFSEGDFWCLKCSPPDRNNWLLPLRIDFIDRFFKKNDVAYLANITRTDDVTGTQMVETALKLLQILGAKKVYLHDGARLYCGAETLSLSFFKLIEKGATFYQKFGFKFQIEDDANFQFNFKSSEQLQEKLTEYVNKLKKIKISYVITTYTTILETLFEIIKSQDYNSVKIELYHPTDPFIISPYKNVRSKVLEMVTEADSVLNIFSKIKQDKTYLYEQMIELFYTDCTLYSELVKSVVDNQLYSITYNSKKLVLKDVEVFEWIRRMMSVIVVKEF